MAYIPVADTVLLEYRQVLFGQKIENTQYFRMDGGFSVMEMTGLMNDMLLWWTTDLAPWLSSDISLREMVCTDLSTQTGISLSQAAPTPNPDGGVGFGSLPGNCAICVSFRTNFRGRSYRGRNFVAGLPETEVTGNTVATATVNGIQAAYGNLPTSISSFPWEHTVVSRYLNGAPRVAGASTPITSYVIVDPFVDSQRRRLTGRGL